MQLWMWVALEWEWSVVEVEWQCAAVDLGKHQSGSMQFNVMWVAHATRDYVV